VKEMTTKQLMEIAIKLAGITEVTPDSGISVEGKNIKKILMGVDMETPELLLARQLGYDLVVAHHPETTDDWLGYYENIHIEKMYKLGIPKNKAQRLIGKKKKKLDIGLHASNIARAEDAARLMKLPFMTVHTPADIITEKVVQSHLDKKIGKNESVRLGEIMEWLLEIPEYKNDFKKPVIRIGNDKSYAGKVYVCMSGVTGQGADAIKEHFEVGVGTLVLMHIPGDELEEIEKQGIGNVIVCPHHASDSIGINKIIAEWEKAGVKVDTISGIISVKVSKKTN